MSNQCLTAELQSAAIMLGLADCEEGKGYMSVVERMNWQREGRA